MNDTKRIESDNWRERIKMELAEIAGERSEVEKGWQRIRELEKAHSREVEIKEGKAYTHVGILKKIKRILPAKKTANDKRRGMAEIRKERIALEKKKEDLGKKREELEKRRL